MPGSRTPDAIWADVSQFITDAAEVLDSPGLDRMADMITKRQALALMRSAAVSGYRLREQDEAAERAERSRLRAVEG